ncbi:hypothetical protein SLEP1_g13991 [Rubroshorea leprosula]|uniref:WAT1-related protein n=1 Tax=Rubroshorea leprosula TaxID=152421 RepID=A0AAV5IRG5_9ROSI|nr:hypothetical protein SLEP1_g13991 [Rubroshorea leprosula]
MESGMKPLVLVAYRQIFSVILVVPFAFFMEWKELSFLKNLI